MNSVESRTSMMLPLQKYLGGPDKIKKGLKIDFRNFLKNRSVIYMIIALFCFYFPPTFYLLFNKESPFSAITSPLVEYRKQGEIILLLMVGLNLHADRIFWRPCRDQLHTLVVYLLLEVFRSLTRKIFGVESIIKSRLPILLIVFINRGLNNSLLSRLTCLEVISKLVFALILH